MYTAEKVQARHSVRMPLGSAMHAFKLVALAGLMADTPAVRTALRAVRGGHLDKLHAEKRRLEGQSLRDETSYPT